MVSLRKPWILSGTMARARAARWVLVATALLLSWGGCDHGQTTGGADIRQDFLLAADAPSQLQAQLDASQTPEAALAALAQTMTKDSRVVSATTADGGRSLWVTYASGLKHVFLLLDTTATSSASTVKASTIRRDATVGETALPPEVGQVLPEWTPCALPNSRKAWVASAMFPLATSADTNYTPVLSKMLSDRGYEAEWGVPDIDSFRHLTDYGVIYIETAGSVSPDPSTFCIMTTTEASDQVKDLYVDDLQAGLVVLTTAIKVGATGLQEVVGTVLGVTPAFVRQYDKDNFPDNTLLCLACQGEADGGSEWAQMLHDKCATGRLITWLGDVPWPDAARAGLNLFQMLTGSNEEFSFQRASMGGGTLFPLLQQNTPPCIPLPLDLAYRALQLQGYTNGGGLYWLMVDEAPGLPRLILAPGIIDLVMAGPQQAELRVCPR